MTNGTNPRVAIEIYVDDQGSVRIREFKDNFDQSMDQVAQTSHTVTSRIKAGWESVKGAWVEITAGLLALNSAWNMMNMAAKAEQEKAAFTSMAASFGADANKMLESLKEVSHGAVAEADLVKNAGTAMMMGIQPEAITAMMKIAAATSKQTGQDVTQAFDNITLASARESKMILDNLGIMVNLEKAYDDYARANNTTAEALTDAQRKQAFMNAALKEGGDLINRLGNQGKTKADELQAIAATFENIKVKVGDAALVLYDNKGFVGALAAIHLLLPQVAAGAAAVITSVRSLSTATLTLGTALGTIQAGLTAFVLAYKGTEWLVMREHLNGIAEATGQLNRANNGVAKTLAEISKSIGVSVPSMDAFNQAVKSGSIVWDAATASWMKGKKAIDENREGVNKLTEAEKKLIDQRKKVIDDAKKQAEEQKKITGEMYKEAGISGDAYFKQEAEDLVAKAASWKKAGGDTLAVEDWLYGKLTELSKKAWGEGQELSGVYIDNMQAQVGSLTDEFTKAHTKADEVLSDIAGKADALDGTTIGLLTTFDGSAVIQGIDGLIAKFRALQDAAAATGPPPPPSNHWDESTNDWMNRVGAKAGGGNTTTITNNFNGKLSRSDIANITSEQARNNSRS